MDYIAHYGVAADANPPGRGSGRYPKGSGSRPYQHGLKEYTQVDGSLNSEGMRLYGDSLRKKKQKLQRSLAISRGEAARLEKRASNAAVTAAGATAVVGVTSASTSTLDSMIAVPAIALATGVSGFGAYAINKGGVWLHNKSAQNKEMQIKEIDVLLGEEKRRKELNARIEKGLKENGSRLNKGGAEEFRKDRYNELVSLEKSALKEGAGWGPKLSEATGETFNPKKTAEYLRKATKNFNEYDPDQVVYQHMGEAHVMREKGYITKETFNKLYDAQISEDAWDNAGYLGTSEVVRWHDIDKK